VQQQSECTYIVNNKYNDNNNSNNILPHNAQHFAIYPKELPVFSPTPPSVTTNFTNVRNSTLHTHREEVAERYQNIEPDAGLLKEPLLMDK
jgi:hypothetical protein